MQNETLELVRTQLLAAAAVSVHPAGESSMEMILGLSPLLFVGNYGHFVYNVKSKQITFFSQNAKALLGLDAESVTIQDLNNLIHPNDLKSFIEKERTISEFYSGLTRAQCFKFKAAYDFRMRRRCGSYIRVYKQSIVFESDKTGKPVQMLVMFTDITHLKTSNTSSITYTGLNGEAVPAAPAAKITASANTPFSKRELEVLRMVASNVKTNVIASTLFISPHTVKIHRKNLLKKAGVASSFELVLAAKENGWI